MPPMAIHGNTLGQLAEIHTTRVRKEANPTNMNIVAKNALSTGYTMLPLACVLSTITFYT